ncbi:MAG TPA: hypothetical protein VFH06_04620 [Candidatus Saccharimonadales bacterium]|nr:hypothetical protein [Candidatus Saccharimonadales bacterium]
MQETNKFRKNRSNGTFRKWFGSQGDTITIKKSVCIWLSIITVIIIILLAIFFANSGTKSTRSESYKEVTGAAGLQATISYDCGRQPCNNFDFNVYIFNERGQQVNVVRPDKDGKVSAALAEGKYVLLVGKPFGKDKLFPEEPLVLKNGQELELKLHYKEEAL